MSVSPVGRSFPVLHVMRSLAGTGQMDSSVVVAAGSRTPFASGNVTFQIER